MLLFILSLCGLCHHDIVSFCRHEAPLNCINADSAFEFSVLWIYNKTNTTYSYSIPTWDASAVLRNYLTSIKSPPSFCMTTFRASLANLTAFVLQSRGCGCYVSRQILAPPLLRLRKHTYIRSHDFAHSLYLWHQPRLANITRNWNWRICGINSVIPCSLEPFIQPYVSTSLTFFGSFTVVCISVTINIYASQSLFPQSYW